MLLSQVVSYLASGGEIVTKAQKMKTGRRTRAHILLAAAEPTGAAADAAPGVVDVVGVAVHPGVGCSSTPGVSCRARAVAGFGVAASGTSPGLMTRNLGGGSACASCGRTWTLASCMSCRHACISLLPSPRMSGPISTVVICASSKWRLLQAVTGSKWRL